MTTETEEIVLAYANLTRMIDEYATGAGIQNASVGAKIVTTVKSVADLMQISVDEAMETLHLSNEDKEIVQATLKYESIKFDLQEVRKAHNLLTTAYAKLGIAGSTTRTRTPRTDGESAGRSKVVGEFHAVCPICQKDIKGSERSLATNSMRIHMEKEHDVSREEFNEKYRAQINEAIYEVGESQREEY